MKALMSMVCIAWLASTAQARTVSYAVVVGNNAPPPDSDLAKLRYADDDAVRYYELLSQFSRTTLLSTLDDETQKRYAKVAAVARMPTLAAVRQVFAALGNDMRLDREAGNDPVLYFVFSGHGAIAPSGEAYLAFADGALTQKILFDELLASLPTPRAHVIIDACHAAGLVGVRGGNFFDKESDGRTEKVNDSDAIAISNDKILERYPNVGVITATTLGNETHEWSAVEGGVFSYEVLSGLAGPADVNGDQTVEYSELQAFVANANRSIKNPRAVPMMVSEPPRADRRSPLIKLPDLRQSRLVHGFVGGWGHFSVELEGGRRLLDANMSGERPVTLALPKGETVFVRTANGEARITSGAPVALSDVKLAAPAVASRGGIDADYRDNLFVSAYGPTYYRGFVDSHGGVPVEFTINLQLTADIQLEPQGAALERARRHNRVGIGFLIGAGALTAVAAVAGGIALYQHREFERATTYGDAVYPANSYHVASIVFWSSASAALATALIGWSELRKADHLRVEVMTSPGGPPGLSLSGAL